jgi:hypothetical protein
MPSNFLKTKKGSNPSGLIIVNPDKWSSNAQGKVFVRAGPDICRDMDFCIVKTISITVVGVPFDFRILSSYGSKSYYVMLEAPHPRVD